MDLSNDRAIEQYFLRLLKQGTSLYATTEEGTVAGLSVNFASTRLDPKQLRDFASYRQDPDTKDFLNFTAQLQETPNLWNIFKQTKIFEIKMVTVMPDYRRQGLGVMLAEKSMELAKDLGYNVIRMDCIHQYDYKIAERCNMQCLFKFPLHKLRDARAPFIDKSSEYHRQARVYVDVNVTDDVDDVKTRRDELESLVE